MYMKNKKNVQENKEDIVWFSDNEIHYSITMFLVQFNLIWLKFSV